MDKCSLKSCSIPGKAVLLSPRGEWVEVCQDHIDELIAHEPRLVCKGQVEMGDEVVSVYTLSGVMTEVIFNPLTTP